MRSAPGENCTTKEKTNITISITSHIFRYTFLGFGQGPRACLAMRFALLEAKVALMSVVRKFELLTCSKTVDKIELDPKSALGGNKGGLWVKSQTRLH